MNKGLIDHISNSVVKIQTTVQSYDLLEPYKKLDAYNTSGSGTIINEECHIVTCYHVIENSIDSKLFVSGSVFNKLFKSEMMEAELVNIIPDKDIAVIQPKKIKNSKMKIPKEYILEIADEKLKVGNDILTAGYPLSSTNIKISQGIITGIENNRYHIDATINPGNSGGALIYKGKLVGIPDSAIISQTAVGQSIPINQFTCVYNDKNIQKNLFIPTPFIGIQFSQSSRDISNILLPKNTEGIFITYIHPKSYMEELKYGDMITKFDGHDIDTNGMVTTSENTKMNLYACLSDKKWNSKIPVEVYRSSKNHNYKKINVTIRLDPKKNPNYKVWYPTYEIDKPIYFKSDGIVMQPLNKHHLANLMKLPFTDINKGYLSQFNYIHLQNDKEIIIVTHVDPSSHHFGIVNIGDHIQLVNGKIIESFEQFQKEVKEFSVIYSNWDVFALYP